MFPGLTLTASHFPQESRLGEFARSTNKDTALTWRASLAILAPIFPVLLHRVRRVRFTLRWMWP